MSNVFFLSSISRDKEQRNTYHASFRARVYKASVQCPFSLVILSKRDVYCIKFNS